VCRVTLDTNIYVSAFEFGAMRLLHMAIDGDIQIAISQPILDEILRVLRQKFRWDGYRLHDVKQRILGFSTLVEPAQALDVIKEDEPDNRILECAVGQSTKLASPALEPITLCWVTIPVPLLATGNDWP